MEPSIIESITPWLHSAPAAALIYVLLSAQIRRLEGSLNNITRQVSDLRRRVSRLELRAGIDDTATNVTPVPEIREV